MPAIAEGDGLVLLLVYRRRNEAVVRQLLAHLGAPADVRLWALDEVAPSLVHLTLGSGPGGKFELVNRLYAARPVAPGAAVAVADDDVLVVRGSLDEVARTMAVAPFDLAAPGHAWYSHYWLPTTRARIGTRATRTRFVEIGPVFVVGPAWRDRIIPFREDIGMGWVLQLDWWGLEMEGCRLGIVDPVRMVHLRPGGGEYDTEAELARCEPRFAELGGTLDAWEAAKAAAVPWRRWQAVPPWAPQT